MVVLNEKVKTPNLLEENIEGNLKYPDQVNRAQEAITIK